MQAKAKTMLRQMHGKNKVCRLRKSLYGLRQAGRQWHKVFDTQLKYLGLIPTTADPCVYTKRGEGLLIVAVYVDDIIIASQSITCIKKFKADLMQAFEVKDLGEIQYCLGIEFQQTHQGYAISQKGYIQDILKKFGMEDCKSVSTPMDPGTKLTKIDDEPEKDDSNIPYRELIGALMYLAIATRPDIAHAVSYLSQFNSCFNDEHWKAAKRVLRYLKGTINCGIVYRKNNENLKGYVDADWGNCQIDRRSYTGYVFILSGGAISWESRKQRTVALSSTEAEYMGMTEAVKEAILLQRFLTELE